MNRSQRRGARHRSPHAGRQSKLAPQPQITEVKIHYSYTAEKVVLQFEPRTDHITLDEQQAIRFRDIFGGLVDKFLEHRRGLAKNDG